MTEAAGPLGGVTVLDLCSYLAGPYGCTLLGHQDRITVLAEDLVATLDHPQVGRYRAMKEPVKFTDTPGPAPTPAPTFGQHSDQIPTGCGYSAEEIASLRQRGVVF